jgi:8-hydroxy-5-deazaflavin:NADPH oxidoreductase
MKTMNVTLIGAGNMGRGIGYRLVAGGHSVTLVDSNPEAAQNLASELRSSAKPGATVQTATMDNVKLGDVVILAVWYGVNLEIAKQLGSKLSGKVVVDIANPLNATYDGLTTAPDSSSAEDLAKVVPASAKVVKAFNTTFAGTLVTGNVGGVPLDVLMAGDDEAAKQTLAGLITDSGLVPVDAGPLHRARQLEALGLLGITLQFKYNWGFTTAWKIISPN